MEYIPVEKRASVIFTVLDVKQKRDIILKVSIFGKENLHMMRWHCGDPGNSVHSPGCSNA